MTSGTFRCDEQGEYNVTYIEFFHIVSKVHDLNLIMIKHGRNLDGGTLHTVTVWILQKCQGQETQRNIENSF